MNTYLARITECVHGYVSCTFGDCPGGTTTRIEPDYEAAAKALSDMWKDGVFDHVPVGFRHKARAVVDAALGGSE